MIMSNGVGDVDGNGVKDYLFFDQEIFGLDRTLNHLVEEYLNPPRAASTSASAFLMLVGPVGGGKSTLVTLIKKGWNATAAPTRAPSTPSSAAPCTRSRCTSSRRVAADFKKELGVYIEGDLCPVCRYRLDKEWNGDIASVPVQRITLSERDRRGVGTFKPADPKSQDVAELTGSVNISTLAEIGSEADPRAYNFDGELNIANRGRDGVHRDAQGRKTVPV
jgi:serine protein kinase